MARAGLAGVILSLPSAAASSAHPGGLNAEGCHNNRRTGDYHCHGAGRGRAPQAVAGARSRGGAFANCSAARAAGAAPVRRGDPGYGAHLDRDGDGVGCE
ncbi:MAG: excalibur calcium-binding domain-containing protein [Pseudomonadota bacterium]|nr:excalibur calcium-binding domain-containing protein [Pseudomonadota bacterium]